MFNWLKETIKITTIDVQLAKRNNKNNYNRCLIG